MIEEISSGLKQVQKTLPTVLLYDKKGSSLFEEITKLDEYYLTRTELDILQSMKDDLANYIDEKSCIVELGSGSSTKSEVLLEGIGPAQYFCVDVSEAALQMTVAGLQNKFPDLHIHPILADFTDLNELPEQAKSSKRRVIFFPGSTIGNFEPSLAQGLLRRIRNLLQEGDVMIIGSDTKKDSAVLENAYNDEKGITAAFNLNLLNHVNYVANANFNPNLFEHKAVYNENIGRMEMHLISLVPQTVVVNGTEFRFEKGESIHTENSYKYTTHEFADLSRGAGFVVEKVWTDQNNLFAIYLLRVSDVQ